MTIKFSRRDLLKKTAGAAAAAAGGNWMFAFDGKGQIVKAAVEEGTEWTPVFFTQQEADAVAVLAEAIIPRTDTPGATDARCHECMDLLLSVEKDTVQDRFKDGLEWIRERSQKEFGKPIPELSDEQVTELLEPISDLHEDHPEELQTGVDFFEDLKERTIFTYYTSKEGWVEELGRPENVGMEQWQGCADPSEHA